MLETDSWMNGVNCEMILETKSESPEEELTVETCCWATTGLAGATKEVEPKLEPEVEACWLMEMKPS